jgi:hypothetical protein
MGGKEAHTSYHSSVSKSYPGLTVSVGYSDFGDQPGGPSLEEIRQGASQRLNAGSPRVRKLYVHFATAPHGYRRLRALLAPDATSADSERGFAIQVMAEGSLLDAWVHLHAKPADAVAEKLAFDFALAQLAPGGAAAKPGRVPDDSVGGSLIADVAFDPSPTTLAGRELSLEYLRQREPSLRALATAPDQAGEAARGQFVARAYVAAFDDKPYSEQLFAQLATFNADERDHGAKLLVLLLSDTRWAAGVAAVRAHASGDAAFTAWLAPLLMKTR